jgi:hypothetical protein
MKLDFPIPRIAQEQHHPGSGMIINQLFNTQPLLVHAHGAVLKNPTWPRIKAAVFSAKPCRKTVIENLSLLTCNNGNKAMGLFEQSASLRGISCIVSGFGIAPWVNSRDKPRVIYDALLGIDTEYVLYADSRDAVVVGDLSQAIERLSAKKGCDLLFGADRINWPALPAFRTFETSLPGSQTSQFRYLNGGAWIGRTDFCREFFSVAIRTPPVPEVPESEQGILKVLFQRFYPRVQLDYRCEIFQNIGYVLDDIFEIISR